MSDEIAAGQGPEAWLGPCVSHAAQEHAMVNTHGQWMCVLGLRGMDDGWPELEADRNRLAAENESLREQAADFRDRTEGHFSAVNSDRDRLTSELRQARAELAQLEKLSERWALRAGQALKELAELDAAYKTLQARCEVHWLERQSAEAHRDRYRAALKRIEARGNGGGTDALDARAALSDDGDEAETAAILNDPEAEAATTEGETGGGPTLLPGFAVPESQS